MFLTPYGLTGTQRFIAYRYTRLFTHLPSLQPSPHFRGYWPRPFRLQKRRGIEGYVPSAWGFLNGAYLG